jgi:hypothetical protein
MSDGDDSPLRFSFQADVIYWRGPAPFFFVAVPAREAAELRLVAKAVSYGWGMVPVEAAVRRKTDVTAGDMILVEMTVQAVRR